MNLLSYDKRRSVRGPWLEWPKIAGDLSACLIRYQAISRPSPVLSLLLHIPPARLAPSPSSTLPHSRLVLPHPPSKKSLPQPLLSHGHRRPVARSRVLLHSLGARYGAFSHIPALQRALFTHAPPASKEWVIPAKPKPGRKPKKDTTQPAKEVTDVRDL